MDVRKQGGGVDLWPGLCVGLWILCGVFFSSGRALAWGPSGHRVAAEIARHFLQPQTSEILKNEFGIEDPAGVANWADEIKNERKQGRWHYTNIPGGEKTYQRRRDCPGGECVTEIIGRFEQALRDPGTPKNERAAAARYLIHFVADVHQPLHAGRGEDRGGNTIPVFFHGREMNLHAVWDDELIPMHRQGEDYRAYAARLISAITPGESAKWLGSGAIEWTRESRVLALRDAYMGGGSGVEHLSNAYVENAGRVIEMRLQQAGVRLADMLNRALAHPPK